MVTLNSYMSDYIQYKWMDLMFQLKDCYIGFLKKKNLHAVHISNTREWKGEYTMQTLKETN